MCSDSSFNRGCIAVVLVMESWTASVIYWNLFKEFIVKVFELVNC